MKYKNFTFKLYGFNRPYLFLFNRQETDIMHATFDIAVEKNIAEIEFVEQARQRGFYGNIGDKCFMFENISKVELIGCYN